MILNFTKMHGLGNDFAVFNMTENKFQFSKALIKQLGDRNFGIGFDQMLLVERPKSSNADFLYRIFNRDGSEVEHCGNGARCFAKFVLKERLTNKNTVVVDTKKGQIILSVLEDGNVSVNMGKPLFESSAIPLNMPTSDKYTYKLTSGVDIEFFAVSMGNPHAVILVKDVQKSDVQNIGKELENSEIFPQKANIGFLEIISSNEAKLRVWERGVGETLACGTGACAAFAAAHKAGFLHNNANIKLLGGNLDIQYKNSEIFMVGSATFVYNGQISV